MVVVGTGDIDVDVFAVNSAVEIGRDGGADKLAGILPRTPDKPSANLIATTSIVRRASCIKRVMAPKLSLPACRRADTNKNWMLERLLELPGTAGESSFFEDGCPAKLLGLQSRFEDKLLKFELFCPPNGSAVLEGSG